MNFEKCMASICLVSLGLFNVYAEQEGDYTYSVENDKAIITAFTTTGTVATIPETLGGYPVAAIGANAFKERLSLESVVIGDGVTEIGSEAFRGCTNLLNLTFGAGLKTIRYGAFGDCKRLESVTLPDALEVLENSNLASYGVFSHCFALESVTFGSGLREIGGHAFYNCQQLAEVTLPATVTTLGKFAFYGCSALKSACLNEGLLTLNEAVFASCASVTNIALPSTLGVINGYAFENCAALQSLIIPDSVTNLDWSAVSGCAGLRSVVIGGGVTGIGANVFKNRLSLETVVIGDGVTEIGSYAFSGCTNLLNVTFGAGVEIIQYGAFKNCSRLASLTFPDSLEELGDSGYWENGIFYNCTALQSVTFGSGLKKIGQYTFNMCTNVTELALPDSVVTISAHAFESCMSLRSIHLGANVQTLGDYAFWHCFALTQVVMPETLLSIGAWVFDQCNALTGVYFKGNAPTVSSYTFSGAPNVTAYYLPATTGWGDTLAGRPTAVWSVAAPVFMPPDGTPITNSLQIAITCATEDASIYYTLDGTDPTTNSLLYNAPLVLTDTTTVMAKAFRPDIAASPVVTATYYNADSLPVFSSPDGTGFDDALDVMISTVIEGAVIRYTLDGGDVTALSPLYKTPLHLTASTLLKARLFLDGVPVSPQVQAAYTQRINGSLECGNLSFASGGDATWFGQATTTHDGVDAAQSGDIGDSQQSWLTAEVEGPGDLSFWWKVSSESGYDYLRFHIDDIAQFSLSGTGADWVQKQVALGEGTHTLKWSFTKDGSVSHGEDCGWLDEVLWDPLMAATPAFDPVDGSAFETTLQVSLSCATEGAEIRYTLDGSTPTTNSALYASALELTETATIKARAFKSGMAGSAAAAATYTKLLPAATPAFAPADGATFETSLAVSLACATEGAEIRYTLDGSTATTNSALYASALTLTETTTIKARAFKAGLAGSAVASATYTKLAPPEPRLWHVDAAMPDDTGDGLSWSTAKQTLQAAIDVAAAGDTVVVTNGLYAPIIVTNVAIKIYSVNGAEVTVIDADRNTRCALLGDTDNENVQTNAVLEGFTLQNGDITSFGDGGGAWGGTLRGCILSHNWGDYGGGAFGSALYGCTLEYNNAAYSGGGASGSFLEACRLTGNTAEDYGGGADDSVLHSCVITGNDSYREGGGTYACDLTGCTVVGNMSDDAGGVSGGTTVNSLIWDNEVYSGSATNYDGSASINYSSSWPLPLGTGNIDGEPVFLNVSDGDYRIREGSPGVDAGNSALAVGDFDFLGNARVQGAAVDMGACEGAVSGYLVRISVVGHGTVTPAGAQVVPSGGSLTVEAVQSPGPFLHYLTNGVLATTGTVFTWQGVDADGEVTAVFGPAVLYVNSLQPDDMGDGLSLATAKHSIQGAIDAAWHGDAIWVTNGLYAAIDTHGKRLAIRSVNGADETVIDGDMFERCATLGDGTPEGRATLTGFTLRRGYSFNSGAGALYGVLTDCVICGNTSDDSGGGVSRATLVGCVIEENTSARSGGALSCLMTNCIIRNNHAYGNGGGTYLGSCTACVITNNISEDRGGGGYYGTFEGCLIANNQCMDMGGGAYQATLAACEIAGNISGNRGGGACYSTLTRCVVSGNTAIEGGGTYGGSLSDCLVKGNRASEGGATRNGTLINVTVTGNIVDLFGGGVSGGTQVNCIIWDNWVDDWMEGLVLDNYDADTTLNMTYTCTTPAHGGAGNISVDPLFVNAAGGDYSLAAGSPCLDAGTSTAVEADIDLAGSARIQGAAVDLGAYERAEDATVSTPTFDPADGTMFETSLNVSLACATEGAEIRFTLDGSEPTTNSALYASALELTETTTVKARAFKAGKAGSSVASATYTKLVPSGIIRIEPATLSFGSVVVGCSATNAFSVFNDGESALSVSDISCPTGFAVSTHAFVVSAGSSVKVGVAFAPVSSGTFSNVFVISSDAMAGGSNVVAMGTGVIASPVVSQIVLNASSVIGGSGSWPLNAYNATDLGAQHVVDNQSGTVSEPALGSYWLGRENSQQYIPYENEYFVLDLGAEYVISRVELFNTHNQIYNDRGTRDFIIYGAHDKNYVSVASGYTVTSPSQILSGVLSFQTCSNDPIEPAVFTEASGLSVSSSYRYIMFKAVNTFTPTGFGNFRGTGLNEIRLFRTTSTPTVATPTISPVDGSVFDTTLSVTLNCATAGATIRYTLDGREPSAVSPPYTTNIVVAQSTVVKARAFKLGSYDSMTAVAIYSRSGQTTQSAPVPVPHGWLGLYRLVPTGDYEAAALMDADGDGFVAWEEYVAGTCPTNALSLFLAQIVLVNGEPKVTWIPDLGSERRYTVQGKALLSNPDWASTNATSRFFRVKVEMP